MQGYNKYRRILFQKENLIPRVRTEKEKQNDEKKDTDALAGALSSDEGDSKAHKNFAFHSKEECFKVKMNFAMPMNLCFYISCQYLAICNK